MEDILNIEILEYPVYFKLGFYREERYEAKKVLISLNISLKTGVAYTNSDNIAETLDYGVVAQFLDQLLLNKEILLIETVVNQVGQQCLETFTDIKKIKVTVEKTCLPEEILKTARVRCYDEFVASE